MSPKPFIPAPPTGVLILVVSALGWAPFIAAAKFYFVGS